MSEQPLFRVSKVLISGILMFVMSFAYAQRPVPTESDEDTQLPEEGPAVLKYIDTDSFSVNYISGEDLFLSGTIGDTSLSAYYHHNDPTRRRNHDWVHTGIPGSPARPVLFNPGYVKGNQAGIDVFDFYDLIQRPARTYLPEKAFANLSFLRGSDQDDYLFEANFATQLGEKLNISLDYERLPQIGEYRGERLKNSSITTTLKRSWLDGRLLTYFTYAATEVNQENNGGITTDSLFGQPGFQQRVAIPVFIDNSQSLLKRRKLSLINQIELFKIAGSPVFTEYEIRRNTESFKFFDISNPLNESYYTEWLSESRGLRHAYSRTEWSNQFRLSGIVEKTGPLSDLRWQGGLSYDNIRWDQEAVETRFNEIHLWGRGKFTLFDKISARAHYSAGFFDAANNTNLELEGKVELPASFYLGGAFRRTRNLPGLLSRSAYVSFRNIYTNEGLNDVRINKLSGLIGSNRLGSHVEINYFRTLNWIYFNENGFPEQLDAAANVLQVSYTQFLKWRVWNFQNSLVYHLPDSRNLGIVEFMNKSSFFYEGRVLSKSSLLRIGVDFRYIQPGTSVSYFPLNGQWIIMDDDIDNPFMELDVFVAMKVKVFRAFVRFDNLINAITGDVGFVHARYPMQESGLRIGINWIFVN